MSTNRSDGAERERDERWRRALQHAFDVRLSEDDGHSRPRPTVFGVSANGLEFEVELRWLANHRYCCMEWGCFVGTYSRSWWGRFRASLRELSDREPPPLSVRIHAVVEDGVVLTAKMPGPGRRVSACHYDAGVQRERDAN